jgi:hypothetical protein
MSKISYPSPAFNPDYLHRDGLPSSTRATTRPPAPLHATSKARDPLPADISRASPSLFPLIPSSRVRPQLVVTMYSDSFLTKEVRNVTTKAHIQAAKASRAFEDRAYRGPIHPPFPSSHLPTSTLHLVHSSHSALLSPRNIPMEQSASMPTLPALPAAR